MTIYASGKGSKYANNTLYQSLGPSSPGYATPAQYTNLPSPYGIGGNVLGASTSTLSGSGTPKSTYVDPFAGMLDTTKEQGNADLQSLQTEYDRNRSNLEMQLGQAGTARQQGLSSLQSAVDEYGNLIGTQKTQAQQSADKQIQSAGSAARQSQAKSRNVLRALGILSSSAAGDILSKPMTEFATQKADINLQTQQRIQQLDDAFRQKTSEHANLVAELENNYNNLISQIQNDLRFSDRERADAVRQANAAVSSRLNEIKLAQANWQNQVNSAKSGLLASATQLQNWANPTANIGDITSTTLSSTDQYNPTEQASIVGPEKDKLSSLYA